MAQQGQHVLIVDDGTARRRSLDVMLQQLGCRVTLAVDGDEALAVLRPTLHPLIVVVNAQMSSPANGASEPLLFTLLTNQEFAAAHAFIATVTLGRMRNDEFVTLRESIQTQAATAYVRWLRLPARLTRIADMVAEAEQYLKDRAQRPTP